MKPLTIVQQAILTYIKTYISEVGYSPSFKDIKEHRGYSSENAVRDHLISLTKKGHINTTDGVPRSIVVLTENNGWISVSDRFPEKDGRYLIVGHGGNITTRMYYVHHDDKFFGDVVATHWQPLPQPPSI